MGFFNFLKQGKSKKKEKTKKEVSDNYDLENKLFPISKPWGYSPGHVSEAVKIYNDTIEKQMETISVLKESLTREKSEYKELDRKYRTLHMQLNLVSVPTMTDIQEEYIQKQFKEKFVNETPKDSRTKSEIIRDARKEMNPMGDREDGLNNTRAADSDIIVETESEINEKEKSTDKANKFDFFDIVTDPRESTTEVDIVETEFISSSLDTKNNSFDASLFLNDIAEDNSSADIDTELSYNYDDKNSDTKIKKNRTKEVAEEINNKNDEEYDPQDFINSIRF